jgi:ketosteroid isomerase-like protein
VEKDMSNRELVQRMTEAFLKGDMATVQEYWSEDIVWYFPGRSMVAGVFHGKEAVVKHLSDAPRLGARLELTPRAFFGDEQYGVVLYELNTTRNGQTLVETRVMLCTIDNDKIIEVRIYPEDQYALDEFWS